MASDMFDDVIYNIKSSDELREAMKDKIEALEESRARREERVAKLREEYAIGPERLADLLVRFRNEGHTRATSYDDQGSDAPLVPAGVIANLVRERDMLSTERDQRRKLELILRNIKDTEPYVHEDTGEVRERPCIHRLTDEELEYLGF
jgi:hypothetical protein